MSDGTWEQQIDRDQLRAGDTDRDRTNAVLAEASARGYLTMTEFDERTTQVLGARTLGDLRGVLADLPVERIAPAARVAPALSATSEAASLGTVVDRGARNGFYAHLGSYVGGVAVMLGIWLVVGLATGAWYFWPVWPILGWGIGVASHGIPVLTGRGGHCHQRAALTSHPR